MHTSDDHSYVLYVRKSTDSSDRQVQSIDDQMNCMRSLAQARGLFIAETICESKSAKAPNTRDGFNRMIELIHAGEIDGILTYAFDRLSRNPVDSANIKWLLQTEKIKRIVTCNRDYLPEDNALLLSIEDGMANEYIRKLKRDVRRGMVSKFKKGIYPSMAPIGYRNCPYDRDIKPDPKYFPIVRKMWDMLLSGKYQVPEIHTIAAEDWRLKSPKRKKLGGTIISRSLLYKVFHNPFYMGIIKWDGMTQEGIHKPMVTPTEFEVAQSLIESPTKKQCRKNNHPFTGIMRCRECNCQITAETQYRDGKVYTYYYCTGRAKYKSCSQKGQRVRFENLTVQISRLLETLSIDKAYYDEAIRVIEDQKSSLQNDDGFLREKLKSDLEKWQKRKKRLTDLLIDEIIDSKEYKLKMKELESEIVLLKTKLKYKKPKKNYFNVNNV